MKPRLFPKGSSTLRGGVQVKENDFAVEMRTRRRGRGQGRGAFGVGLAGWGESWPKGSVSAKKTNSSAPYYAFRHREWKRRGQGVGRSLS